MEVGMIGLGKLGYPVAVAMASKGHQVWGYDSDAQKMGQLMARIHGLFEPGLNQAVQDSWDNFHFADSVQAVVEKSEIIFIAVPTPHQPEFDGTHPGRNSGPDFDYSHLTMAASSVGEALQDPENSDRVIVIISTVLPGTTRNQILPTIESTSGWDPYRWSLFYNPSFIAMGQTIQDFLNPEFVLIGSEGMQNFRRSRVLRDFYSTLHKAPVIDGLTWEDAEAVKMFYNTFIGLKIIFANTVMQICDGVGPRINCDRVLETLAHATDRLISPKYLKAGMGDGGACHPRDNLALSNLSRRAELSYNLFSTVMFIREEQARWIASLMCQHNLPKVIMGKTYKPGTNLTDGSPSLLLARILKGWAIEFRFYDINTDPKLPPLAPSVYLIALPQDAYINFNFFPGSVVIDPWGKTPNKEGIQVIRPGRGYA